MIGTTLERLKGGSLLRRTLLSVLALLVASSAFIGLVSMALVSAVELALPSSHAAAATDDTAATVAEADGERAAGKPTVRPKRIGALTDKPAATEKNDADM